MKFEKVYNARLKGNPVKISLTVENIVKIAIDSPPRSATLKERLQVIYEVTQDALHTIKELYGLREIYLVTILAQGAGKTRRAKHIVPFKGQPVNIELDILQGDKGVQAAVPGGLNAITDEKDQAALAILMIMALKPLMTPWIGETGGDPSQN